MFANVGVDCALASRKMMAEPAELTDANVFGAFLPSALDLFILRSCLPGLPYMYMYRVRIESVLNRKDVCGRLLCVLHFEWLQST